VSSWHQPHNSTRTDQLPVTLGVSWSRARSWHGEDVTIQVRSSRVVNGGQITLEIFPVGHPNALDTLPTQTMNGATLDHVYTIDWKAKAVPAGAARFVVRATLAVPKIVSPDSDPLAVDLTPPLFST
jgi:hypothetical protein